MLNYALQKLIFSFIPASLTINNAVFEIQSTFGEIPLSNIQCPTVNLSFISNGTPFDRSIEQTLNHDDSLTSLESGDIRTVMLRYKIAATNMTTTVEQSIVFNEGQLIYGLNSPVLQINSVEGFPSTAYQLSPNRDSIIWTGQTPTPNTSFTVSYNCIFNSYLLASEIMDYLIKDILGNSRAVLATYDIDVLEVFDVVDISTVYEVDPLTVFAVDVQITYPFSWTRQIPEEEATVLEAVNITNIFLDQGE